MTKFQLLLRIWGFCRRRAHRIVRLSRGVRTRQIVVRLTNRSDNRCFRRLREHSLFPFVHQRKIIGSFRDFDVPRFQKRVAEIFRLTHEASTEFDPAQQISCGPMGRAFVVVAKLCSAHNRGMKEVAIRHWFRYMNSIFNCVHVARVDDLFGVVVIPHQVVKRLTCAGAHNKATRREG
jgi:hypothetical protein